jgi:hypothetical protein
VTDPVNPALGLIYIVRHVWPTCPHLTKPQRIALCARVAREQLGIPWPGMREARKIERLYRP